MIDAWERLFAGILGSERVTRVRASSPGLALRPADRATLVEVVRAAFADRIPLVPRGGDTAPRAPAVGEAPPACFVDLVDLNRVVAHAVDDFTLTAEAGLRYGAARALLAPHGQQLPFVATDPQHATLGGLLAVGDDGPTLAGYGALRDQILGIEIVHGDGRVARAGGRVVKNVTGYDLSRLAVGSRGVLGILTELTFRLRPAEERRAHLAFARPDAVAAWRDGFGARDALASAFALHLVAGTGPDGVATLGTDEATLVVSLRGVSPIVAALEAAAARQLGPPATRGDDVIDLLAAERARSGEQLRIAVLPAHGDRLLGIVGSALGDGIVSLTMDVLCGVVDLRLHAGTLDASRERALGEALAPLGAQVDLVSDPTFHARRFEHFPSTRPDGQALMAGLRRAFDPAGLLNPGRYEIAP